MFSRIISITPSLVGIPCATTSVLRRSRTALILARYSTHPTAESPLKGSTFQQSGPSCSGCAATCCRPLLVAGLHMNLAGKVRCTDAFGNPDSLSTEHTDSEAVSSLSLVPGPALFGGRCHDGSLSRLDLVPASCVGMVLLSMCQSDDHTHSIGSSGLRKMP